MKNQMIKAALCGTALLALGLGATSAQAATATAFAKAKILKQITVTKSADLDFGTIVTGAAASTVTVSSAGVRTCGAGLTCTNPATAAAFGVTGTSGAVVTLAAAGPVTLTGSNGGTMSATLNTSAATMTLTAGPDPFTVGGVLSVGANQTDGVYQGSFTVTVDYQ
ncbi:MAG: DUF4402 domain-containing protein [Sphingomonadaceae bacterium]|nr:DUF4402 domain-containing protein [Sphingomonadaceae bacterium]